MLINKNSSTPVYTQIINQYKRQIVKGILAPNDILPSVRSLSVEIGINPNTLQKAYAQMEEMGICYTEPGKGRFVSENAAEIIKSDVGQYFTALGNIIEELAICNIDMDEIVSKVNEYYTAAVKKHNL